MSYETPLDRAIREATERGAFDDLPGAGKPLAFKRPGDPDVPSVRDYMGKAYSFHQDLDDGHRPWAMKPLAGYASRQDQNIEYHLAPARLRPIFLRVLLDCIIPAA